MISGKINLSKINKDKLFKGEKGIYLDIVMFDTPDNKYGDDYVIVQGLKKEDRDAGEQGPILGNAKIFDPELSDEEKEDLPF